MERRFGGLGSLNFPLFADISKDMSRNYGVLVEDVDDDMYGASLRGVFIIDDKGTIRHVSVNDDHVGRNVDEVLRTIEAFQYADVHGEVCPANWRKGSRTIKPDQQQKLEFFGKEFESAM